MTPDQLLDTVNTALYAWDDIKAHFGIDEAVIEQGKWVLHYAKTLGWYL